MNILINILTYEAIWLLGILWGNQGAVVGCVLLIIHLLRSKCRAADLKVMGFLFFLGLLVDGTLQLVGLFSFTNPGFPIPFWLLVIWLGFSITPHHSLAWLKNRLLLASLFGALGGPAAYWAGTRLGAATFNWPLPSSLIVLFLVWSAVIPTIMLFSRRCTPLNLENSDRKL